jgi:hypothetical protein
VPAGEDDHAGDGDRNRPRDHEPGRLVVEDVVARERQAREQGRDGGDHGEEEPDAQSQAGGLPLPQERHAEEDRDEPVEARQTSSGTACRASSGGLRSPGVPPVI